MKFINLLAVVFFYLSQSVMADTMKLNNKNTEVNFYTGMFDFSDDGKRSSLFGVQHQNED